jgi:hypothetical protein
MTGKKLLIDSFLSVRRWFQLIFLGITLAIGIQFTWFVFHLEQGVVPDFNRPPRGGSVSAHQCPGEPEAHPVHLDHQ